MTTYLLDTQIISDLVSASPDATLVGWVDSQPEEMMYLSVVTLAEIKNTIDQVQSPKLRKELDEWVVNDLLVRFAGRISEIDVNVTLKLGEITARFQALNLNYSTVDALNIAIAIANEHTFVTSRIQEFTASGARLFNPYLQKNP